MGKQINFSKITLRTKISHRGGGIEIDLTTLGFEGEKMSAYQNYLGGGMLGRICSNDTVRAFNKDCTDKQEEKLDMIAEQLKKYYHSLTNPSDDEFENQSYEQNQSLPSSAY